MPNRFGIEYQIVEDYELPRGVEAACIPEKSLIQIRNTTYVDACRNDGRARFTIIHELGHLLLGHQRSLHRDNGRKIEAFENSEWQANQYAAELLMPLTTILDEKFFTPWEIQCEFGVSRAAAEKRIRLLIKHGDLNKST